MRTLLFILLVFSACVVRAQNPAEGKMKAIGVEVDVLPYVMKGYYGSVWVGREHFRYRAIITHLTNPSFLVDKGFRGNKIQAYTVLGDYFFSRGFQKWWIGVGFEYWRGSIQRAELAGSAKYNNIIATVGGGYVWRFYRKFYLNPWFAFHARIGGDSRVDVNGAVFRPAMFTPEASLKLGWYFSCRK